MNDKTIKLVAVGDLILGDHPFTLGHGVTTVSKDEGCDFIFKKIKSHLQEGDIVCGNLEGIISPKKPNETGVAKNIFWGDSCCSSSLESAGFNCLFLANNHTAQHGQDALNRTCELLDNNNIKWTGYNPSDCSSKPVFFNIKDINIGVLSYCDTQQYHLDNIILPMISEEQIEKDIFDLKKTCDVIIISLHWGDEFINYPSSEQIRLGRKIIDFGANLILGHHSHNMQGIEKYNNGLIVYSLGTFVIDLWKKDIRESVLFSCDITKKGVADYNILPIFINDRCQPEVYEGEDSLSFMKKMELLSDNLNKENYNLSDEYDKKYVKEVEQLTRIDKFGHLLHYIKNIHRFNKKMLFENILLILKRRILRKNI